MMVIICILLTTILFLGNIALMAKDNDKKFRVSGYILLASCICGVIYYGYGFAYAYPDNLPLAVLKASLATLMMFLGRNDFSAIKNAPGMTNFFVEIGFWLVHLASMYVTTNAVLASIGSQFLKELRSFFYTFYRKIVLIYGVNDDSVTFAKSLAKDEKRLPIVFIDGKGDAALLKKIESNGWVFWMEDDLEKTPFFKPRKIAGESQKLYFYCMTRDETENVRMAKRFRDLMELRKIGITECGKEMGDNIPEGGRHLQNDPATSLVMFANMEAITGKSLLATKDVVITEENGVEKKEGHYGYGSVMIWDRAYLLARSLVENHHPAEYVSFNEKGEATGDFHTLIIGQGKIGQTVLRMLYMQGQFLNAKFIADVFDIQYTKINGYLLKTCPEMQDSFLNATITWHDFDAREYNFYDLLDQYKGKKLYIVVCTGDEELNRSLSRDIMSYTGQDVFECSYTKIFLHRDDDIISEDIYSAKALNIEKADRMAMRVNQAYFEPDNIDDSYYAAQLEKWKKCDYFGRISSRSVADFFPAYKLILKAMKYDGKNLTKEQKLNLAKQEHLRWSAFHLANGYKLMSAEIFEERAKNKESKIQKDVVNKLHACLVPWEELKPLSDRQNDWIEKNSNGQEKGDIDYIRQDENNIALMLQVIESEKKK